MQDYKEVEPFQYKHFVKSKNQDESGYSDIVVISRITCIICRHNNQFRWVNWITEKVHQAKENNNKIYG